MTENGLDPCSEEMVEVVSIKTEMKMNSIGNVSIRSSCISRTSKMLLRLYARRQDYRGAVVDKSIRSNRRNLPMYWAKIARLQLEFHQHKRCDITMSNMRMTCL